MPRVVEHVAELTGYRDRDVLDVSLVGALKDLLQAEVVAVYRCVGEGDARRWLLRARLGRGDTTATCDALWSEPETLPLLDSQPEREACLSQRAVVVGATDALTVSCFPLLSEVQSVGVLEITSDGPLTPVQRHLVDHFLRIHRNVLGLLDYSERDTLTGLLNRKTFEDNFQRVAAQDLAPAARPGGDGARRSSLAAASWLAVVDVDHFKRVNDRFGHLIGDEVLLLLSRLLRASFRAHDRLYRFGGEEFVALMHCDGADGVAAALERLRERVASYAFPQVGRVTVSIGFARLRPGDTPALAFERADAAMYLAKDGGRNQVAQHDDRAPATGGAAAERLSEVELF